MTRRALQPALTLVHGVDGDSQTQWKPVYATRGRDMHGPMFVAMLRDMGIGIRCRTSGVGGDTTAGMLRRVDELRRFGRLDSAEIEGGVNDATNQPAPVVTPAATGGVIAATAPNLFFALVFVSTDGAIGGFNLANFTQAVQLTAGATNAIAFAATALTAGRTGIQVYLSTVGYPTAAAAIAADTRTLRLATTLTGGAATVTTLPAGTAAACPSVGTQANLQAWCKARKYDVLGFGAGSGLGGIVYASQAQLPANAPRGMRSVVMDDSSATGGRPALANDPRQHATIAGDYSAPNGTIQSVWEARTSLAGEAGWGRVAITGTPAFDTGTALLMITGANYLNFHSGTGDNIDAATGFAFVAGTSRDDVIPGVPYAPYVAVRAAQATAAQAEGALFADVWRYQSGLIAPARISRTATPATRSRTTSTTTPMATSAPPAASAMRPRPPAGPPAPRDRGVAVGRIRADRSQPVASLTSAIYANCLRLSVI